MRRKSARNAGKAEKAKVVETPRKITRRTTRSQKLSESPSASEDSDDEPLLPEKVETKAVIETVNQVDDEGVWKITKGQSHPGELQKLKISLSRPAPLTPERTTRRRRNKSAGQQEEDILPQLGSPSKIEEEDLEEKEDKKGKGKSKGKNKSKVEKTPPVNELEMQMQYEISENVQVTPQSPSDTDKPVDKEPTSEVETNDNQSVNEKEESTVEEDKPNLIKDEQSETKENIKTKLEPVPTETDIKVEIDETALKTEPKPELVINEATFTLKMEEIPPLKQEIKSESKEHIKKQKDLNNVDVKTVKKEKKSVKFECKEEIESTQFNETKMEDTSSQDDSVNNTDIPLPEVGEASK